MVDSTKSSAVLAGEILNEAIIPATAGTQPVRFADQFSHDAAGLVEESGKHKNYLKQHHDHAFLQTLQALTRKPGHAAQALKPRERKIMEESGELCTLLSKKEAGRAADTGLEEGMRRMHAASAEAYGRVAENIASLCAMTRLRIYKDDATPRRG